MATANNTTITPEEPKLPDKRKLTDRALQALKPAAPGKRRTVWDTEVAGLAVRVTDRGVKSFVMVRRRPGRKNPDRVTLGTYPDTTLREARELADEARKDLKRGIHPREKERARLLGEARRRKDTFEAVAEEFIKRHLAGKRRSHEAVSVVRRSLITRWGTHTITEITRRDVVELLREIIDGSTRRSPVSYAAHHAWAAARKLFAWALAQDLYGLESSPCDKVNAKEIIGVKAKRKRVLTDAEIRLLWNVTGELDYPLGPLARLLLVTGQRLREIAHGEWREVDLGEALWVIPHTRMKAGVTHELPLSPLALHIVKSLPRFQGGPFLFSSTGGKRPVSGFSKYKLRLDKAMLRKHRGALGLPESDAELRQALGLAVGEPIPRDYTVEPWSFHDLRRTMRTRLSALPIPDEVKELMISHKPSGLHQVYDQHSFRAEKRDGFERWASRLLELVQPAASTVLTMSRKAR
jgi:integrase